MFFIFIFEFASLSVFHGFKKCDGDQRSVPNRIHSRNKLFLGFCVNTQFWLSFLGFCLNIVSLFAVSWQPK